MRIYQAGRVCFYLCALLIGAESAYAGAWPTPDGEGQIIATTIIDTASSFYDDDGKRRSGADFSKFDSLFYLEYGLTDRLTLVGNTSVQDVDYVGRNGPEQYQGFGDSEIGLRYNLVSGANYVVSVQALAVIGGGGESVSDADLGNGGNGAELRILGGYSYEIGERKGFAELQTGWRTRSAAPDDWRLDATVGLEWTPRLKYIGQGFYSAHGDGFLGIDRVRKSESLKLAVSTVYEWKPNRSVQVGYFQTVSGRNTLQEKAVIAAIWQRF